MIRFLSQMSLCIHFSNTQHTPHAQEDKADTTRRPGASVGRLQLECIMGNNHVSDAARLDRDFDTAFCLGRAPAPHSCATRPTSLQVYAYAARLCTLGFMFRARETTAH